MRWRIVLAFGIWVVSGLVAEEWTIYTAFHGLPSDTVLSIAVDPFGFKWAGTLLGLSRFDGTQWTFLPNLGQNPIYDLAIETGVPIRLWVGTEAGISLFSISNGAWQWEASYTKETQPLVSNRILTVTVDSGHTKWFGTDKGISLLFPSRWDSVPRKHLSSAWILSFGYDKNTGWNYIGTKGGGVSRVRIDSLEGITSASPYDYTWASLPSDTVYAVWIDSDGNQWFGTEYGLAYHQGTDTKLNWFFFNKDSGMTNDFVQAILRDSQGLLWVGTPRGVSCYTGFRWVNFDFEYGVNAIAEDLDGSLWFATDRGKKKIRSVGKKIEKVLNGFFTLLFQIRLIQAQKYPFFFLVLQKSVERCLILLGKKSGHSLKLNFLLACTGFFGMGKTMLGWKSLQVSTWRDFLSMVQYFKNTHKNW